MAEEKRRGRRPTDAEARKRKLERLFTTLLDRATEEEFLKAMRDLGLSPDSEPYRAALTIWRENRRLMPAGKSMIGTELKLDGSRVCGAPGQIRTADLLVRSQTLYPTELRALAEEDFLTVPDCGARVQPLRLRLKR